MFSIYFKNKLLESVSDLLNEADENSFDKEDEQNIAKLLITMANEIDVSIPEQIQNIADAKEESFQENKVFDILKSFAKKVLPEFLLSLTLFNPSANAMNVPTQVSIKNGVIEGTYFTDTKEYMFKRCNDAVNEIRLKWGRTSAEKIKIKDLEKLSNCPLNPVQMSFMQTQIDYYDNTGYMDIMITIVKDIDTDELTDQFSVSINTLSYKDSVELLDGSSHEAYDLLCDKVIGFKDHISYETFMSMIKSMSTIELQDLVQKSVSLATKEKK